MREILFKGKAKYNGQHFFSGDWVEGFYAYKELDGKHLILVERAETQRLASYFVEVEVYPETICRYTSEKDKNGKMIFEGDIVRDSWHMTFKVIFIDGAFMLKQINQDWYDLIVKYGTLEVIGNAHN